MKIICIGRNYLDHILEMKNEIPKEPQIFLKADTSYLANHGIFHIPLYATNLQFEAEIILKISKKAKNITISEASQYFDEISIGIDFTERDLQAKLLNERLSWELSKAFDESAAVGDFIPVSGIANILDFDFHFTQNGKTVQKSNVKQLVFNFYHLISYISKYFTLNPGDLIYTGTPSGVNRVYPGDQLEGFISNQKLLQISVK
jgi:2-keto-4-pentenoate hydratase/2-oxohepta-3-ene-1,7-dioic acid hydratase in catechol pathway